MQLSRRIPDDVKREVRQRCGFGCVRCGSLIFQYHHFDPPFNVATEHRASGITLLCGGCHDEATRGLLSPESVRKLNAEPFCLEESARHALDLAAPLYIVAGTMMFVGSGPLFTLGGRQLLELSAVDGRVLVNASFVDDLGNSLLQIHENELLVRRGAWDAQFRGPRLIVNRAPREVVLEMIVHPPHSIYFPQLALRFRDLQVRADSAGIEVTQGAKRSKIVSEGGVIVNGGGLELTRKNCRFGPGLAIIPYPASRFRSLVQTGALDTIFRDLYQPRIHVQDTSKGVPNWLITDDCGNTLGFAESRIRAIAKAERLAAAADARVVVNNDSDSISFMFDGVEIESPSMRISGLSQ